jgi:uncharacterized protein
MGRKIALTVKPNAKKIEVITISPDEYRVAVREPARDGRANRAVVDLLARHLGVPKSMVKITRGLSSRHKLIEIGD